MMSGKRERLLEDDFLPRARRRDDEIGVARSLGADDDGLEAGLREDFGELAVAAEISFSRDVGQAGRVMVPGGDDLDAEARLVTPDVAIHAHMRVGEAEDRGFHGRTPACARAGAAGALRVTIPCWNAR